MNRTLITIVSIVLLSVLSPLAMNGQDCYQSTRKRGISLMEAKKYKEAIPVLQAAKDCPDMPAGNDIDAKIKECRSALSAKEPKSNAPKSPSTQGSKGSSQSSKWEITGVVFGNTDKQGNVLTPFGNTLYSDQMRYLQPRISYKSSASKTLQEDFYVKIIRPDGTLISGSSSPKGYSYVSTYDVKPGTANTITASGWGTESSSIYSPGPYTVEIWCDGKKKHSASVVIKAMDYYLTVDGNTALTQSFSSYGGSHTFTVSTNASSWETWGVPSWCTVESRTSTGFVLKCNANSGASRSDYMKIKAGNLEVRIDIKQEGSSTKGGGSYKKSSSSGFSKITSGISSVFDDCFTSVYDDKWFRFGPDASAELYLNTSEGAAFGIGAGVRARLGYYDTLLNFITGVRLTYIFGDVVEARTPALLNVNFIRNYAGSWYAGAGYEFNYTNSDNNGAILQLGVCGESFDLQLYYLFLGSCIGLGFTLYY